MATPAEAEAAVKKFNGSELDGRTLKVEIAKAPGLGGGGSRGGGGGPRGGNSNRGRW
jgi:RNA recognition motif-containing protein